MIYMIKDYAQFELSLCFPYPHYSTPIPLVIS